MPASESIRTCPICGKTFIDSSRGRQRIFCSKKCSVISSSRAQNERIKQQVFESRPIIPCPVCGTEFKKFPNSKKYCSDVCKNKNAKSGEKGKIAEKAYNETYYEKNKEKIRERAKLYMRERLRDEEFKKSKNESNKRWAENNPDKVAKRRSNQNLRRLRHSAHVQAWRVWLRSLKVKHDQHVRDFRRYLNTGTDGQVARYYKSIGLPWKNPRFSEAMQYKIRYRLDQGFRMAEINRNGWRKEVLRKRDDGTANFWALLHERKTCPYCGMLITKENAVADHMDPIKLGGANGQHNLTICCKSCNTKKSGKPFLSWVAMLPEHRRSPAMTWYKRKHGHGPEKPSFTFSFA